MKEFSESQPASELEHLWYNLTDLRVLAFAHKKCTSQQQFPVFFAKLYLIEKPSFKMLTNNKFKNF